MKWVFGVRRNCIKSFSLNDSLLIHVITSIMIQANCLPKTSGRISIPRKTKSKIFSVSSPFSSRLPPAFSPGPTFPVISRSVRYDFLEFKGLPCFVIMALNVKYKSLQFSLSPQDAQTAIPKGTLLAIVLSTIVYIALAWIMGATMNRSAPTNCIPKGTKMPLGLFLRRLSHF